MIKLIISLNKNRSISKIYMLIISVAIISLVGYSIFSNYVASEKYVSRIENTFKPDKTIYNSGEFLNVSINLVAFPVNNLFTIKQKIVVFTQLELSDSYMISNDAINYPELKKKVRTNVLPYTMYEFELSTSKSMIFLSGKIPAYNKSLEIYKIILVSYSLFGKSEIQLDSANKNVLDLTNTTLSIRKADFYNQPIFKDNWYYIENIPNQTFRWMSQDATIFVYSPLPNKVFLNFSSLWSFNKPRTLQIFLNDIFQKSYTIDNTIRVGDEVIELNEGKNIITFHSVEGCEKPYELNLSYDNRCLSFAFFDVDIIPLY